MSYLIDYITDFATQLVEIIGFLNIFFCLTLMLVGTLAKMAFDKLNKINGRTNKVINWVTIIVGLVYWYYGGVLYELVFSALAFQRAFELIFHWIERFYVWLFLLIYSWIKPAVDWVKTKFSGWFDWRLYNK